MENTSKINDYPENHAEAEATKVDHQYRLYRKKESTKERKNINNIINILNNININITNISINISNIYNIFNTNKSVQYHQGVESVGKSLYGDRVFLTVEEYSKLVKDYGERTIKEYIERLNDYIGQSGKKYKSHYYAIRNFLRRGNVSKWKPAPGKIPDEYIVKESSVLEDHREEVSKLLSSLKFGGKK